MAPRSSSNSNMMRMKQQVDDREEFDDVDDNDVQILKRSSRRLTKENTALMNMLEFVRCRCDSYGFFRKPVDPVKDGCENYFNIINEKEAMDLQTLEEMIRSGDVDSVEEFDHCIERIIRCSRKYNEDELSFIRIQTEKFSEEFQKLKVERVNDGTFENVRKDAVKAVIEAPKQKSLDIIAIPKKKSSDIFQMSKEVPSNVVDILERKSTKIAEKPRKKSPDVTKELSEVKEIPKRLNFVDTLEKETFDLVEFPKNASSEVMEVSGKESSSVVETPTNGSSNIIEASENESSQVVDTLKSESSKVVQVLDKEPFGINLNAKVTIAPPKRKRGRPRKSTVRTSVQDTNRTTERRKRSLRLSCNEIKRKSMITRKPPPREAKRTRKLSFKETKRTRLITRNSPRKQSLKEKKDQTLSSSNQKIIEQIRSTKKLTTEEENDRDALLNLANTTASQQGSSFNAVQGMLIEILRRVRGTCDTYGIFSNPVDPIDDGCEDYYEIIPKEEAMDLSTMEVLVKNGSMNTFDQFEACIEKIISNARKYNENKEDFVRVQTENFALAVTPILCKQRNRFETLLRNCKRQRSQRQQTVISDVDGESKCSSSSDEEDEHSFPERQISSNCNSSNFQCKKDGMETKNSKDKSGQRIVQNNLYTDNANGNCTDSHSALNSFVAIHNQADNSAKTVMVIDGISSRHRYVYTERDAAIPGATIPPTRRDLSTSNLSDVNDRSKWMELIPEMMVVCNEAARRAKLLIDPTASRYDKPLSKSYIEERLEYDKPLKGYIVRSKEHGDLQGFIVSCNFMVFRETFRWDSLAPQAGITPLARRQHRVDDGSLAQGLLKANMHGNVNEGLVFDRIAEISLLGGLGCGGPLLRKLLDALDMSGLYDFVVLQATKMAITFYEKHGFIRVGAVARFEDNPNCPEVSYRHWGDIVCGRAVEASYMMALRLPSAKAAMLVNSPSIIERQKSFPNKNDTPRTAQKKVSAIREAERVECLKIARSLAKEALELTTDTSIGQTSYVELLSLSRDASKSGRGYGKLAREIQKALSCFKKEGNENVSKSMLRAAFNLKEKCIRTHVKVDNKRLRESSVIAWVQTEKELETNTKLEGRINLVERRFTVNVKVAGKAKPQSLVANVFSQHLIKDNSCCKEAMAIAFHLFSKVAFDKDKVDTGDMIMVPTEDKTGEPNWQVAEVMRKCKPSDDKYIPGDMPYRNAYLCEVNNGERMVVDLVDSMKNRGVGRQWCSLRDWSGFSSLPLQVLDVLLDKARVKYYNKETQQIIHGYIKERIGGGLHEGPQWRVVSFGKGRKGKGKLFSTSGLRDFLIIKDESMIWAFKLITSTLKAIPKEPKVGFCHNEGINSNFESSWVIPKLTNPSEAAELGFCKRDIEEGKCAKTVKDAPSVDNEVYSETIAKRKKTNGIQNNNGMVVFKNSGKKWKQSMPKRKRDLSNVLSPLKGNLKMSVTKLSSTHCREEVNDHLKNIISRQTKEGETLSSQSADKNKCAVNTEFKNARLEASQSSKVFKMRRLLPKVKNKQTHSNACIMESLSIVQNNEVHPSMSLPEINVDNDDKCKSSLITKARRKSFRKTVNKVSFTELECVTQTVKKEEKFLSKKRGRQDDLSKELSSPKRRKSRRLLSS